MALKSKRVEEVDERDLFPADDGKFMDDTEHQVNAAMLQQSLGMWLNSQGRTVFIAADNAIYYDQNDAHKVVGPDFYVVLDTPHDPERDCWRMWNEGGHLPQLIMEFVSKHSGKKDRVTNFAIYRDILRVSNYFIWDNRRRRFDGFHLQNGTYKQLEPDARGLYWCEALKLNVGLRDGWVRFFDTDGNLLLTGEEVAAAEELRFREAEQRTKSLEDELARARAEIERLKARTPRKRRE